MPEGAVYVGRPSKWGNPYLLGVAKVRMPAIDGSEFEYEGRLHKKAGERCPFNHSDGHYTWHQVEFATRAQVVELFRRAVLTDTGRYRNTPSVAEIRAELRGRDLACWCPLDQPCHADVLLAIANGEVPGGQS